VRLLERDDKESADEHVIARVEGRKCYAVVVAEAKWLVKASA
jgi:hypothetical protein